MEQKFRECDKSLNWSQFKDLVSLVCLAGNVVRSWSLTQEVVGLNPFAIITNIFAIEFH